MLCIDVKPVSYAFLDAMYLVENPGSSSGLPVHHRFPPKSQCNNFRLHLLVNVEKTKIDKPGWSYGSQQISCVVNNDEIACSFGAQKSGWKVTDYP